MTGLHGRTLLIGVVLFLVSTGRAAGAEWPVPRGVSREPVPYRYDPAVWNKVPKEFLDDAPACTLYAGVNHLVEEDGTIETITHEIVRLNSRKALEKLGEYRSITYTPAHEKLTLNEARVIKADGTSVPVEPKHVQVRDLGTDFQVYDHGKMLIISFPTLEVGDSLEVRWTVRGRNPEHGGHFFNRYRFGDDNYPVVCDEMRIQLPKSKPLVYGSTGGKLEPFIAENGEQRTYHWKATNRSRLPQDDSGPSKEELRLYVAFSTFPSWHDVYEWKYQLRKECWTCTPRLAQIAAEVTKGLKTPTEKARALTYWVKRNIRYVSVGEKHDYTPHKPAQVLDNRYGDCKDTSQLLAVMLREAGIEVGLVTLGTLDDGQILEEVPSPWGTHAILLVTIEGKEHWIDTTASMAGWDHLPRDDRDRVCYVVEETGLRLLRTPAPTPESNRIETVTRLTVGADGSTRMDRTQRHFGSMANNRRHDWADEPVGERRRLLTSELQDAHSSARLVRLVIDEAALNDFDQPVQARIVFEVPGHFTGEQDREGSITDSTVWGRLLAYTFDTDRKVGLNLGGPFESRHRYVISLPPGYYLDSAPRERTVQSRWGSFRLQVNHDPATPRLLEIEYHTRLDRARVEVSELEAFRKFHDEVSKHYRTWMTIKPSDDMADAPILEAMLRLMPGDTVLATALARTYLAGSKPEEARRVVKRARHYQPNDVALAELAVDVATGTEQEEAAYLELVKRFPGTLKYRVFLGEVLVKLGKHAEARKQLAPVLKEGSTSEQAKAHYQVARSWFEQDKAREALKHLDQAAAADAESVHTPAVLLFRGRVQERLGLAKGAAETYRQVLKLKADAAPALEALIRMALEKKDVKEAQLHLVPYAIAVADDPAGLAQAAAYNLRLGRAEEAFGLATRAREEGSSPLAERTLGLIQAKRGNHAKAIEHLEAARLDADVLEALVRSELARGHVVKAVRTAAKAEKVKEPTTGMDHACALASQLERRRQAVLAGAKVPEGKAAVWGRAAEALVCAEQLHSSGADAVGVEALLAVGFAEKVELGPAFALRGQLLLERGKLMKALADANRAVALSPKEARGHYVRGRVRLERGDIEALADLTRAAELSGRKDGTVLHALASALYRAGRKGEALTAQREAVKLNPDDRELAEQLEEIEKGVTEGVGG